MSREGGRTVDEDRSTLRFRVADMDCASCLRKIEDRLRTVDGVRDVQGSVIQRTISVEAEPDRVDAARVRREVGRLGYLARSVNGEEDGERKPNVWRGKGALIAVGSMALFGVALLLRAVGTDPVLFELPFHEVALPDLFFLLAALVGGWNFFPKGVRAARVGSLDMNFLMTVAILGAVGIGEYMEGAAIAFLFALAELLENYSVDRARASVGALMDLAPDTARVIRDGAEERVGAEELVVGDLVALRPGDRVPADGRVESGSSAVDQAPITGESMPVPKRPGDELYAGTINKGGFMRMEVVRPAAESSLSRIIHLVADAESRRTRSERFVERFARVYTPAVTAAAVAVMLVPPLLFGAPFALWFVRGLTLLVIACPCALVISTPVAVVSGITAAARNGVLIKGGTHLEAMGEVKVLALDKTGTLTLGHPEVVGVHPADGVSSDEILARAAAVESRSEHPIARAIMEAAHGATGELAWEAEARAGDGGVAQAAETRAAPVYAGRGDGTSGPGDARPRQAGAPDGGAEATSAWPVAAAPWAVTDFVGEVGRGAVARLDGVEYAVGSPDFLASRRAGSRRSTSGGADGASSPPSEGAASWVGLAREGRVMGWIGVADPPKANAAGAIQALRRAGLERIVLLSGDREETAEEVGRALGVDEVRAGLLPEEKVDAIEDLHRRYGPVAMVGDGVNDAPALASATVGIAMGAAGSDTALETADIALMGDDLTRLAYLYDLSHRAGRVIRQNIGAAIAVKALLALGVPLGAVSLIAAVIVGDMGVSLAVILNALRLGRLRPEA